jgi:integral membrane sensor domain MASE1
MEIPSWDSKSNWLSKILVVATSYFVLSKLGLLLARPPGIATAVWLPSGVALAAILIWGSQVWPGIWMRRPSGWLIYAEMITTGSRKSMSFGFVDLSLAQPF